MALWMDFPDGAAGAEASGRGGRPRGRRGKGAAAAATVGGPGFSRVRLHRPKFARLGKAIVVRSQHGPDGALVARHSQRHILRECPYHVCHVLPAPRGAGLLVIVRFATDIDTAGRGSGSGEEAGKRDDAGAFGRPGGPRTHFSVFHLVLTRAGDLEVAQAPPRVDINDAWGGERAPQCALWPGTAATGADYLLFHVAPGAVGFSLWPRACMCAPSRCLGPSPGPPSRRWRRADCRGTARSPLCAPPRGWPGFTRSSWTMRLAWSSGWTTGRPPGSGTVLQLLHRATRRSSGRCQLGRRKGGGCGKQAGG